MAEVIDLSYEPYRYTCTPAEPLPSAGSRLGASLGYHNHVTGTRRHSLVKRSVFGSLAPPS
jgi:hypothetical protein